MIFKCEECGCILEIKDTDNPQNITKELKRHGWTTGYAFYNSDLESYEAIDIVQCPDCFPEGLEIVECTSVPTEEQYPRPRPG